MFPPENMAGATFTGGDITGERDAERIQSEQQQWRLISSDNSSSDAQLSSSPPPIAAVPIRRVNSEFAFRFPDEVNLIGNAGSPATTSGGSFERVPGGKDEEEDLLAKYMDLEKIESGDIAYQSPGGNDDDDRNHAAEDDDLNVFRRCRLVGDMCGPTNVDDGGRNKNKKVRDGTCEVKKAMSPDKLAELWVLDPKRAKRILANRQSAARSKERKARYIVELEKRVQSLRTEATALSVQFSLFERDTSGLTNENTELQRQLESLEQHAQLRDALIDALKQEIDRLKVATGEPTTTSDTFIMQVQNIPQLQPQPQPQQLLLDSSPPKLPPLYAYDSPSIANPNHVDLPRPKIPHYTSFDGLESGNTKKPRISPPEPTLSPNVKPQTMQDNNTFDLNLLDLPQPTKVPSICPLDASLYLPSLEPSNDNNNKPMMTQFCTFESNIHGPPQPSESTHHGVLPHEPFDFETNFLHGGSQWAGPGRSGGVLDRSGLVPVGYWAV